MNKNSMKDLQEELLRFQKEMRSAVIHEVPIWQGYASPQFRDRKMFAGIGEMFKREFLSEPASIEAPLGLKRIREIATEGITLEDVTVEQIHQDFYSAGEQLLAEAEQLLSRAADEALRNKVARLRSLGFVKAAEVTQLEEAIRKKEAALATQSRLKVLQWRYTLSRFISRADLDQLCEKYKLVFGPITAYKGSIPEANLIEIENAQRVQEQDFEPNEWQSMISILGEQPNLCIVAPSKDMDMPSMRNRTANFLEDPIVLEPVKGGFYRIITAWGPEALDPSVLPFRQN